MTKGKTGYEGKDGKNGRLKGGDSHFCADTFKKGRAGKLLGWAKKGATSKNHTM